MPLEHLAFVAAIEARDRLVPDTPPYRNSRRESRGNGSRCLPQAGESLIDGSDQGGKLIRRDCVMAYIGGNDLRYPFVHGFPPHLGKPRPANLRAKGIKLRNLRAAQFKYCLLDLRISRHELADHFVCVHQHLGLPVAIQVAGSGRRSFRLVARDPRLSGIQGGETEIMLALSISQCIGGYPVDSARRRLALCTSRITQPLHHPR